MARGRSREDLTPDLPPEESSDVVREETGDGPSPSETTALAIADHDAGEVDRIADAEQELARAQHARAELEAEIPKLDAYVAEARREVFKKSEQHLIVSYAASKGLISSSDPVIRQAEEQMWASGQLVRQVGEMREALPKRIDAAKAAVRMAEQALVKARHLDRLKAEHPVLYAEYEQAMAELEAFEPDYDKPGESVRRKARLHQRVQALEAQIRERCEAFESTVSARGWV